MSEATTIEKPETRGEEPADAASDQAEVVAEESFETADAYLDSLSKSKESGNQPPESRPQRQPSLAQDPRAGQYIQAYRNAHEQRQRDTDGVKDELVRDFQIPEAMASRIVKDFKDRLNAHHADGLRLSGYEAAQTAVQYEQSHIQDAIAASLPAPLLKKLSAQMQESIDRNGVASYQDVMKAIVSLAREDYVDDKGHKQAVKDAFEAGRKQGRRDGTTTDNSNTAKGRVNASVPRQGNAPKSIDEARALHRKGEIDNSQMRQYIAQFA